MIHNGLKQKYRFSFFIRPDRDRGEVFFSPSELAFAWLADGDEEESEQFEGPSPRVSDICLLAVFSSALSTINCSFLELLPARDGTDPRNAS